MIMSGVNLLDEITNELNSETAGEYSVVMKNSLKMLAGELTSLTKEQTSFLKNIINNSDGTTLGIPNKDIMKIADEMIELGEYNTIQSTSGTSGIVSSRRGAEKPKSQYARVLLAIGRLYKDGRITLSE